MANKTAVNVQPLADRVVVLPLEDEEQMRGGLYIPDTAKEKPQSGKIVAVGPGKLSEEGVRIEPDDSLREVQWDGSHRGGRGLPHPARVGHSSHSRLTFRRFMKTTAFSSIIHRSR